MRAIIFDDGTGQLSPLTDLRPSFDIRTGARTTMGRIEALLPSDVEIAGLVVPDRLATIVAELRDLPVNEPIDGEEEVLLVNGRCPLPPEGFTEIDPGEVIVERRGSADTEGGLVVARMPAVACRRIMAGLIDAGSIDADSLGEQDGLTVREIDEPLLLRRPWDVRMFRDAAIDHDLSELAEVSSQPMPAGVLHRGEHTVAIRSGADIWPGVTIDSSLGPVVVASGATVRPGAVLVGPCFIGEGSTVLDRTLVKPHTAIGPRCKIAGEVGGTIFQGFSNKAHEGHLGDSWVGEWVNFGAGTSNSNLLNTYGEVISRASVGGSSERTGQTFLGAMIGDHVKFAISTRIMTGAVIHTGAMWAASGPVTGAVGPFTWATDSGSTAFRLTRFLDTVRTVMGRRGMEAGEAYIERLTAMHEQAAGA